MPYADPRWLKLLKDVKKGKFKHTCLECTESVRISNTQEFLAHMRTVHESKVFFHEISQKLQEKSLKIMEKYNISCGKTEDELKGKLAAYKKALLWNA